MNKKIFITSGIPIAVLFMIIFAAWTLVLLSKDPINSALAKHIPWPIVCTLKGCITATEWDNHHNLEEAFANNLKEDVPTITDTLTTLTRQHIARKSFLKSPVTRSGAKRYREEILNLKDEEQLKEIIDLSLQEYDERIVMPWLQQEALRQKHKVETTDELFSLLSKDEFIIVWPLHYTWDENSGKVVKK